MNQQKSNLTTNIKAAIKACETVDEQVGLVVTEVLKCNGHAIITADHGNAEQDYANHALYQGKSPADSPLRHRHAHTLQAPGKWQGYNWRQY